MKMKKLSLSGFTGLLLISLFFLTGFTTNNHPPKPDQPDKQDQRMAWWLNARFGMFIHWGIYAVPAKGEWYMTTGHVPRKEYEQYAKEFNPVKFDADQWAKIAKDAGMKYMIITSKHHDGFCMFDTKTTDYNVVDATPWHKDPLKMLSEACRKQGIKFGVYYSIMDWHSPYQMAHDNSDPQHPSYNPTKIKPGKKTAYVKYMKTQLKELVDQYDPAVLWFDGEWPSWWTYQDGKDLYHYMKKLNPDIIVNNRVGKRPGGMHGIHMDNAVGDFGTPEQGIPPNGIPGVHWETCMTINHNWGYNKNDHDFKSDTTLIENLVDITSKGGNYLLNVGPTAEGVIPQPEVDRLKSMGQWLDNNGEAVYGTSASPFRNKFTWGRVTTKSNKLYLEVFNWLANAELVLPNVEGNISGAKFLGNFPNTKVTVKQDSSGVHVALPGVAPNAIVPVVELDRTN